MGNKSHRSRLERSTDSKSSSFMITPADFFYKRVKFGARSINVTLLKGSVLGHRSSVYKMIFIQDDSKYVTCSWDQSLRIFDAQTNNLIRTLRGHTDWVFNVISLKNGCLASCSADSSIKVWNVTDGKCLKTLKCNSGCAYSMLEIPNSVLVSGSDDQSFQMWDLNLVNTKNPLIKTIRYRLQASIGFDALCLIDDDTLAVGSNNNINIYKMILRSDIEFSRTFKGHSDIVNTLRVTQSQVLISVSDDKTCKAWEISTGQCLRTFTGNTSWTPGLVIISDTIFATSARDIKLWDINSGNCLKTIEQSNQFIYHLGITKNSILYSCGADKKVWFYKVQAL